MIEIGDRIRRLRAAKGITVNKLANLAGISQSYLREVELGKMQPTILYLSYICDALGVSLKDFFSEDDTSDHEQLEREQLARSVAQLSPAQRRALLSFLESMRK